MTPEGLRLGIEPPEPPVHPAFRLEPLGPEHNERDHPAWMSSIEFIHSLPGFSAESWQGDDWPFPLTLEENLGDMVMHRREFDERIAFAYSVVSTGDDGDVIGCVYIDPDDTGEAEAMVRCWVRQSHAVLDAELAATVRRWLAERWALRSVRFPGRD